MILAGDVGGTKSNLGLFAQEGNSLRPVFRSRFATRDYAGIEELVDAFFKLASQAGVVTAGTVVDAAGFGVAGPVVDGRHYSENLPWLVDGAALTRKLNLKNMRLLNDLAATALSVQTLPASDLVVLNLGIGVPNGTIGVIAAGTGLGEAILFWNGVEYQVAAAEGGMADFAPHTEREILLLSYLRTRLKNVSCEEIASGRGFQRIHEFLNPALRHESFDTPDGNSAGEITQGGLAQTCDICVETLAFWIEMFGGVVANFALQVMTVGGVYVAGGIAAKILPKLKDGAFLKSFCGGGKLAQVLARVPISVVINEDAPMMGAAYEALRALSGSAPSR
jgi:glucokinase